jgi:AAA+ superfamily predicted ATPase
MSPDPFAPSPSQATAIDALVAYWPHANVLGVFGSAGMGKTTILRNLHQRFGGALLGIGQVIDASRSRHPLALEETFGQVVMGALAQHDTVLVDDLHMLLNVTHYHHSYPRQRLLDGVLEALVGYVAAAGKRIVFAHGYAFPEPIAQRAFLRGVKELQVPDYRFIAERFLGSERAALIDWAKVHRFGPHLNGHQLTHAFVWLGRGGARPDTGKVIDHLRAMGMTSNVDLGEVEPVDLNDLKGIDDVIQSLEAKIILPLENDRLASEYGLEPKRGVLIAGPPGTGKTTVGRALAHRLKSKFFLVDGTFISGTRSFYDSIRRVFEAAKRNAPSIIFIDDSDVMFESSHETGFYRYLLTMLDGLESESAGQVCVIMTAMNVGNMPPALIRSGRIDLWLETRLPNDEARQAILRSRIAGLPADMGKVEVAAISAASEGLTGADLRQVVDDGKLLFAHAKAGGHEPLPATEYLLQAVATVRANRERYVKAEAQARSRRQAGPPWFEVDQVVDECG